METKKPLDDEQIEKVVGGTDDEDEPPIHDPWFDEPHSGTCPYCGQTIPFSWWDEHMWERHPDLPVPDMK